jgi:hypothetical protein
MGIKVAKAGASNAITSREMKVFFINEFLTFFDLGTVYLILEQMSRKDGFFPELHRNDRA